MTNEQDDQGAREALVEQLAEAIGQAAADCGPHEPANVTMARAVLPVVAAQVEAAVSVVRAERDEARAEVLSLRTDKATFEQWRDGWIIDMDARLAQLAREEDRADSAEDDLRALREGLEALADKWVMAGNPHANPIRALLASSPAEGSGQ